MKLLGLAPSDYSSNCSSHRSTLLDCPSTEGTEINSTYSSRLFGKDGRGGGQELIFKAQVQVTFKADGESA